MSTLFENIESNDSQFHMEISLEEGQSGDEGEPEEFEYKTEENYDSDCVGDEESIEEEDEEYENVPTEEDS